MQNRRNDYVSTALVISAGESPAAFDIVRTLGLAGIRTAVASSQRDDIAFFSKDCGEKIFLPPFQLSNEEEIVRRLETFASRQKEPPVLYYTSDPELAFLWRYRERLGMCYKFLLPSDQLLEYMFNKVSFCEFARAYRLPIPETAVVKSADDLNVLALLLEYPCIVKPAFTFDWKWDTEEQRVKFGPYKKALRRISSKEQLLDFCHALPQRTTGYLVQSYIEGGDENILSFHGYFDEQSRCLGCFIGRKIRTYPPHTGGSAYIRTIYHPTLAQLSIEYLERVQFKGIVKIDFKWDQRKEEFKIMEINPRYNLWEVLGALAGVNLLYIAYQHQRGREITPQVFYKNDVRLLYFKQDARAFFEGYRATGEWTLRTYFQSLRRKKYYRVFDRKDVRPFFMSLLAFLKRNIGRLLGRSGHKQPAPWEPRVVTSQQHAVHSVPSFEDVVHS
ncbi:MAG: ATP-grasp domain-containing protein [Bacteroidota bacterium]|nr:ATP-grasp domain-containing protein [Bacteroidota bacterium]